jgi:hypothetical protein
MDNPLVQKCPTSLRQEIESNPERTVDLLLRVDQINGKHQNDLEAAGFQIRRSLNLIPTFAVHGPGEALLSIIDEQWLLSVEPDGPVRALKG